MDYSKLYEITVKSQEELNAIPDDFSGRIYVEFGTHLSKAFINRRFLYSVVARGNSSVVAWENSSVVARDNSSVVARDNSSVEAWDNSYVEAWGNSSVVARGNSYVEAWDNSYVVAWENSSVVAWENASVEARENSSVVARENSSVEAWGNSSVVARENASVEAWGNSSVEAWGNSSVEADGNTQVNERSTKAKIKISGNARIVYNPKNTNDFINFYGIKHTKTRATLYKAVHKYADGTYHSDYDENFIYHLGQEISVHADTDVSITCGKGIHVSHLNWALNFGNGWDDLAILEVSTKIDDIICPENTDGKVRTIKIKVIREVPLEECGVYGKILAKRRMKNV